MCLDQFLTLLLSAVIGGGMFYIGWQQWQTNRQRLNLERYDRRLLIYQEVIKILSLILRDAKASPDDLIRFRTKTSQADFLFKQDIADYIYEIYQRGLKLWMWNQKYKHNVQRRKSGLKGIDTDRVGDGLEKELEWLTSQFDTAKKKFKKYLDLSK